MAGEHAARDGTLYFVCPNYDYFILLTTAVLVELHLQRDPPQVASFLHQLERSGYSLRFVNYDGDLVPTGAETILANP